MGEGKMVERDAQRGEQGEIRGGMRCSDLHC